MALEPWHTFLATIATAAAALMGLLFLGLSVNLRVLAAPGNAELRYVARATFLAYFGPFIASVLALIPQEPRPLGVELLIWSAVLVVAAVGVTRLRRAAAASRSGAQRRLYVLDVVVGWVLIIGRIGSALAFVAEEPWAIGVLAAVVVLALAYAIFNSWELVFRAAAASAD